MFGSRASFALSQGGLYTVGVAHLYSDTSPPLRGRVEAVTVIALVDADRLSAATTAEPSDVCFGLSSVAIRPLPCSPAPHRVHLSIASASSRIGELMARMVGILVYKVKC